MTRSKVLAAAAVLAASAAVEAHAALSDEIQVYTDDINKPREFGLELHVNTTPSGRSTPDYPGEIPPAHTWRVTPDFSYGLTRTLEAGLYVPTLLTPRAQQGHALFVALDVDKGPLPFNFGIGRGLNGATDKWTVKAIFEFPLGGGR